MIVSTISILSKTKLKIFKINRDEIYIAFSIIPSKKLYTTLKKIQNKGKKFYKSLSMVNLENNEKKLTYKLNLNF